MFSSLKYKITVTAILIITVTMAVTTLRDIQATKNQLINSQKEKAILLSDRIKHGLMVLMLENRWRDLQAMTEGLVKNSRELKEIRIFHPDTGIMIVSSDPKDIGKKIYAEDMERFKKQQYQPFIIEKDGEKFASALNPVPNLPVCHRCHGSEKNILGVLDIEVSLREVQESIQEFKKRHVFHAFFGSLVLTIAFLSVAVWLIGKPIKEMIRTIKKIEGGDLAVRMKVDRKDELGQLAKSFNKMLESLETAKKQIEDYHEQQVQRAAKLASLGELASGIAHEIRNPLAGISGAIQVLSADFDPSDPRKEITIEMLNQVKRLDQTVRDLLLYARPTPPQMAPNNVNSILEKTLFFIRQIAEKSRTVIETVFDKDLQEIMLDASQIQQIFLNLSINAIQAMPHGGVLKIATALRSPEKISAEAAARAGEQNEWVEIRFEDTGVGIAPEDIKSIFKPFFTKKVKGTGIGLSISQRIVEDHGGQIIVKSEYGKGSSFTVLLPVRQAVSSHPSANT